MRDYHVRDLCRTGPEVRTFMPSQRVANDCMIGIEIELERFDGAEPNLRYWELKPDGSLRNNGIEFVLRQPLTGHDLENAITELSTFLQQKNYEANKRCSTHIHVDVRDADGKELRMIAFIYAMFEQLLFEYVGEDRSQNFYCIPLYRCLENRRKIAKGINEVRFNDMPKYSAINFKCVPQFGSVEFRMMKALQDTQQLLDWTNIIQKIRRYARINRDVEPKELLSQYSNNGAHNILMDVFQEYGEELMERVHPNYREYVLARCMRSAQDILVLPQNVMKGKIKTIQEQGLWGHIIPHQDLNSTHGNILDAFFAGELTQEMVEELR